MTIQPKWRQAFDVLATLCMLACGVALWWQAYRQANPPDPSPSIPVPKELLRIGNSPVVGSRAARVAIIEFSEFECPYCKRFVQNVQQRLLTEFVETGKALFVFRHLPLDMHKHAVPAAIAAECAHQQGRFWAAHDVIFGGSPQTAAANVGAQAGRLGLNVSTFNDCLTATEASSAIQADKNQAAKLGITGTPAFLFGYIANGDEVQVKATIAGAKSYDEFRVVIEGLLK